ncbi:ATP-binding protein [Chitinophaga sp. Cy-1792]|uniref:ATP-binding protein n=1 Tax=Chitinophaga sp. Cy-1792 TaxID=2608339 RepID=UPI0014233AF6|nr:ATP-binding protein [Chitinophaga sp. Cy-1792]NIG54419.1 response regulator [Chitinophaga sp. Cy-1792]
MKLIDVNLTKLITVGINKNNSIGENGAIRNVNLISLLTIICTSIFSVALYFLTKEPLIYVPVIFEGLLFGSLLWFNYKGWYRLTGYLVTIINCCAITYYSAVLGRIMEVYLLFIFVLSVSIIVHFERRQQVICMIIALLALCICTVNYHFRFVQPIVDKQGTETINWIVLGLILFLDCASIIVTHSYIQDLFKSIRKSNRDLRIAHNKLNKTNQQLAENLEVVNKQRNELEILNKYKQEYLQLSNHELRAPLNAITLISQLLYHSSITKKESAHLRFYTQALYQASIYVKDLVNQNLSVGAIDYGILNNIKISSIHIRSFIENLIEIHAYVGMAKNVKIVSQVKDLPECIETDENILRLIIANLLSNAVKYTASNSTITLHASGKDGQLTIAVLDQGTGIPEEQLDLIFEKYFSMATNPNQIMNSSGVGLAFTKKAVELLGGEILVSNRPEGGAVFEVVMPLVPGDPAAPQRNMNDIAILKLKFPHLRVLLVEDNYLSQIMMEKAMQELGCQFQIAGTVADGIAAVAKEDFNIILLDAILPDGDAGTFLSILRKTMHKEMPVIVCSGNLMDETIQGYLEAGANDFVRKPYHFSEIAGMMLLYGANGATETTRDR